VIRRFALALVSISLLAGNAGGQELVRIAAVVNDDVISMSDLSSRILMTVLSSGVKDSQAIRRQLVGPVLQTLIDESLKKQEAARNGITVSRAEMKNALEAVAQRNGVPAGEAEAWVRSFGLPRAAFDGQIKSQLLWAKFINQRMRPTITVAEEEIDEEILRLDATKNQPEYLISEIQIYIDDPGRADAVRQSSERLIREIRGGANFGAVAAQFSQGSLAANGGDLGWVRESQIRPEVAAVVRDMSVGEVSDPIRTIDGIHIIFLRDRRVAAEARDASVMVRLIQVMLPLDETSAPEEAESQMLLARMVSETVQGCDDMNQVVAELESSISGDIGWLRIGDLPEAFQETIAGLEIGAPSEPLTTDLGIHVLMTCERKDFYEGVSRRDEVRARLERQRIEVLDRRLLRDLRRAAFVDLRV
jgi:peptidyl-prolyl cis-trans isomerase SurA